jgi:hypothetical protein
MQNRSWKAWFNCPKCKSVSNSLGINTELGLAEGGDMEITISGECIECGFKFDVSKYANVLNLKQDRKRLQELLDIQQHEHGDAKAAIEFLKELTKQSKKG